MSQMLEEIRQQPTALAKTLSAEFRRAERFKAQLEKRRPRLIVLAARGTSDNAALFGRYLLEITTGIPVSLAAPSIHTLYEVEMDYSGALVVGISQSGESTDTNRVLERARELGAMTVGITNEKESALARLADEVFFVHARKERSVAATKTYTGQMLLFYLLAYALGGRVKPDELRRLPEWVEGALKLESQIGELAEPYRLMNRAVVVGRGLNYANAFEFSLKLMETCYVVAERFSAADFQHGPMALVERNFPVFLFAPPDVTWPALREVLGKLRESKAEAVVITDPGNREASGMARWGVRLPRKYGEYLTPIPYIVPAQMFAACLATEKGLDPDHPRMLSKVTMTM